MSKKRRSFQITSVTSSNYSLSAPSSQGSSSQPTTPSLIRKSSSHDASGAASRFRVVRLASGRGQPYRRGRWTCVDFLEREERVGLRRLMDTMRNAQSLESLDAIGLDREGGGAGLRVHALRGAGHHVHSHGTSHLLANQPIRGEGKEEGLGGVKPLLLRPYNPPTSPTRQESKRPIRVQHLDSTPPLRLDVDSAGRSVLRLSVSQPSSPGVSQPDLNPTMFTLPEDSGAGSSMVAIDNKIEQAMDLVKTHLQTAVREEVEMLREQIKELQERNDELERENYILRALHTH